MARPMEIRADWTERSRKQVEALGGQSSRAVEAAAARAASKTARWLRGQISRSVAKEFNVSSRAIGKNRIVTSQDRKRGEAKLWIGTIDVPVHHLGRVEWSRRMRGARVGRRQFRGSFAPWGDGYPVFRRSSKKRLPINVETISIHEAAQETVDRLTARASRRFGVLLQQELNYEMAKAFD
ncbi:hypothetical protein SAMN05660831_02092 [Thiohalospira halophila DSM 15071]|uniref:Prophage minor tail protein Z (GPZ) n=1 Tax=Thiohalospira halophila DSM 15071 TaxID=1123397 RepID=A0A1I1UEA7_9GAMM|nr:phage tail protein [Thiohalospira halophila]SFD67948.1 hypothetical protein SAMN05660831_02092 [Thiohalospira halophila DSM 15071]